jgi:hypothetical protein
MIDRRRFLREAGAAGGLGLLAQHLPRAAAAQQGDPAATARLQRDLEIHASFGLKFAASGGDHATADWTAERLRGLGYRVDVPEFDAPFFVPRLTEMAVGTVTAQLVPQAPVATTGPAGVEAELSIVGEDGAIGDVAGKIALIITPFARHAALFPTRGIGMTVRRAVDAGAVGVVIVTMGPSNEAVALNCPDAGPFVPVPLAVLAPKDAAPMIAAARAAARARVVIDGEATRRPCKNVIGRLERGSEWIAMSTPRSGWYHCVAERGTGQAAFLEIADWLTGMFPRHSIFVMNTGAHEYFFAGSHHALEHAPPPDRTRVWAHIGATLAARDAIEVDGQWGMLDTVDPDRRTMATPLALDAVKSNFAGLVGLDEPGEVRPQAGELSTFTDMGFDKAFACIGLHRWFHTVGDTIDRVDARLLLPVVTAHKATIRELVGI